MKTKAALTLLVLVLMATLVTGTAWATAPPATTSTITFSVNPVVVGEPSDVTASVTPVPSTGGNLQIQQLVDNLGGNPVACGSVDSLGNPNNNYVTLSMINPATAGTLTIAADTSVIGSFGYRAHFAPASSGLAESASACIDLNVTPPACTGLQIAAANASGTGVPTAGTTFTGAFTITVHNCGPDTAYGVTAQGGTSAWTTLGSYSATEGTVGIRKSTGGGNKILLWAIGDMAPGDSATLTVNLSGAIKKGTPVGTVLNLNGGWSASSGGVKTDYTDPITITVQ